MYFELYDMTFIICYILGKRGGVTTLLRQTPGLGHPVDVGGCCLHVVLNGNKHASLEFDEISDFVDDIYSLIKRSPKRSILLAKVFLKSYLQIL